MRNRDPFRAMFSAPRALIGVIHLPPLPGFAGCPGIAALIEHAVADARTLEAAGFDGVLVENENDKPHQVSASVEVVAAMTRVTAAVVAAAPRLVVGAEILLNDPCASLAVAHAAGARFIRTDYFVDRMARDEYGGEMHTDPEALMRFRQRIGAERILVLADIQVKYARMIEPKPLADSALAARRAGADAVIVTGALTGKAPSRAEVAEAAQAIQDHPVLIGSGLNVANAAEVLTPSAGAIVGTGVMKAGRIDLGLSRDLVKATRSLPNAFA